MNESIYKQCSRCNKRFLSTQIGRIKFQGNTTFSNRYLLSLINTKSRNFYNIFTSGSNLNVENFVFDLNKIKSFYKQKGFFDVDASYDIYKSSSNKYTVSFFINEGHRFKLDEIRLNNTNSIISDKIKGATA